MQELEYSRKRGEKRIKQQKQKKLSVWHFCREKRSVWHLKNEGASCAASCRVPAKLFYQTH